MTTTTPDEAVIGEWLSVRDAAMRLGITERSVFRRLQKGSLRKRTQPDGSVMVLLTTDDDEDMTESEPASAPTSDATAALALYVMHGLASSGEVFRSELRDRDEVIAKLAQEVGRLKEQLAWRQKRWWQRLTG